MDTSDVNHTTTGQTSTHNAATASAHHLPTADAPVPAISNILNPQNNNNTISFAAENITPISLPTPQSGNDSNVPVIANTHPISILTNRSSTKPKNKQLSVNFQHAVNIEPSILPTWRRARTSLANATKASLRAGHYNSLRGQALPTFWAVGLGKMPGFLHIDDQAKAALVRSRRTHGLEVLRIMENSLLRKAHLEHNLGSSLKTAVNTLYESDIDAKPAIDLLDQLLAKDRAATYTILNQRLANLQSEPVTDDLILASMITVSPESTTAPQGTSLAPQPTRGRGRGRGRGAFTVNQRERSRSPYRGRSRGRGRARGTSRGGRGRGRGSAASRSTSPAQRLVAANNVPAMTAEELVWLNALRQARMNIPQ